VLHVLDEYDGDVVDRLSFTLLYVQVADALAADIESGKLQRDDLMPSESDLMKAHGLARGTVRAAVKVLRERGLVYTIGARGTYVGPPPA
jgi:GntR family transcriptional regulator